MVKTYKHLSTEECSRIMLRANSRGRPRAPRPMPLFGMEPR